MRAELDKAFGGFGRLSPAQRENWQVQYDAATPFTARLHGSEAKARDFWQRQIEYLDRDDGLRYCILFTVQATKP